MKHQIIKHILDYQKTIEYVLDQLDAGKSLAECIRKSLDFSKGTFFTLLPENARLEYLYRFEFGGIIPAKSDVKSSVRSVPTLKNKLITFLYKFLQEKECSEVLIDYIIAEPNDSYLKKTKMNLLCLNNNYYFSFFYKKTSHHELSEAIYLSQQPWYFLAVCLLQSKPILPNKRDQFISSIKNIIVGAYDEESYIFWERES